MPTTNLPCSGQCLYGKIKYQVDALQPEMGHCHYSMCRKFHGAAFATYGEVMQSPDAHIYSDYKATWYEIMDDLPKSKDDRNGE